MQDPNGAVVREKINSIESHLNAMGHSMRDQAKSLQEISIVLARQEENLKEHMRRSELNEKAVDLLSSQLHPVRAHVEQMRGAGKFLLLLSLAATVVAALAIFK